MSAIEKHNPLNPNDAGRNFLNFLDQRDAQAHTGLRPSQRVVVMDSHMDDRDFLPGSAQEDDRSNRSWFGTFAIESKKRLRLMITDSNLQTIGHRFDAWMTKLLQQIEDAVANPVLSRVQK